MTMGSLQETTQEVNQMEVDDKGFEITPAFLSMQKDVRIQGQDQFSVEAV